MEDTLKHTIETNFNPLTSSSLKAEKDEDDVFEIVDHTSASPFERFVNSIESVLVDSWKVGNGSLGVLSHSKPSFAWNESANNNNAPQGDNIPTPNNTSQKPFPKNNNENSKPVWTELVSYGDSIFELSYHSLPASFLSSDPSIVGFHSSAVKLDRKARERLGYGINDIKASNEFYVLPMQSSTPSLTTCVRNSQTSKDKERTVSWHKLHRWAGLSHFLVLKPCRSLKYRPNESQTSAVSHSRVQSNDPTSSSVTENGDIAPSTTNATYTQDQIKPFDLDIHGSHLLISAVSVALSNTGCILPVFVQQGEAWKNVHKGICIGSRIFQNEDFSKEIDTCFKMTHMSFIPPSHSNLGSVLNIFIHRFANDLYSVVGKDAQKDVFADYVYASISTTYVFRTADTKQDALVLKGPLTASHILTDSRVILSFGQSKDPVSSLSLEMHYPLATARSYLNMAIDPVLAHAWHLAFSVNITQNALFLSSILTRSLQVWAETFDPNHIMGRGIAAFAHSSGNYKEDRPDQLIRRISVRETSPMRHLVDSDDINNVLVHMFKDSKLVAPTPPKRLSFPNSPPSTFVIPSQDLIAALSSKSLLVPYQSLLWKFALNLMDAASPNSRALHFDSGILALLKGVWSDFLKELRWRWESGIYLPGVQIFAYRDGKVIDSDLYMDLSTPLLHQKLAMFNCCVFRKSQSRRPGSDPRDAVASTTWTPNGSSSPRKPQSFQPDLSLSAMPESSIEMGRDSSKPGGGFSNSSVTTPSSAYLLDTIAGVAGVASSVVGGGVDAITKAASSQTSTLTSLLERVTPLRPTSPFKRAESYGVSTSLGSEPNSQIKANTSSNSNNSAALQPQGPPISSIAPPSTVSELKSSTPGTHGVQSQPISVKGHNTVNQTPPSDWNQFGTSWASERSWGAVSTSEARGTPSDTHMMDSRLLPGVEPASHDLTDHGSPASRLSDHAMIPDNQSRSIVSQEEGSSSHANVNALNESFVNVGGGGMLLSQSPSHTLDNVQEAAEPQTEKRNSLRILDDDEQEGHKRILEGAFLQKTGKPIWEPETQATGVMTEDMIREYEAVLESLGSTPDGTKLRARLQSGQLISDMEAFKAANPHAILEDFVRWHSPRDYEVLPDGTAQLSLRMMEPGNLWLELWKSARRIPAKYQKLLFDPEKEVSKVFEYLENFTPHDILSSLLPTMVIIAYETLSTHPVVKDLPYLASVMNDLAQSINRLQWDINMSINDTFRMDDAIFHLKKAEATLNTAISLLVKLPGSKSLVNRLLQSHTHSAKYEDPSGNLGPSEEITSLPYVTIADSERNAIRDCFCTVTVTPLKSKSQTSAQPSRTTSPERKHAPATSSPLSTVMGSVYDALVMPLSDAAENASTNPNKNSPQHQSRPGSPSLSMAKTSSQENHQQSTVLGNRNRAVSSASLVGSTPSRSRSKTNPGPVSIMTNGIQLKSENENTRGTIGQTTSPPTGSESTSTTTGVTKRTPTKSSSSSSPSSPSSSNVTFHYEWGYPDTREYILCTPPPFSNRMYIQLADGEFIIFESNNLS